MDSPELMRVLEEVASLEKRIAAQPYPVEANRSEWVRRGFKAGIEHALAVLSEQEDSADIGGDREAACALNWAAEEIGKATEERDDV